MGWGAPRTSNFLQYETPSRRDGIPFEVEMKYRACFCQYISDLGSQFQMVAWVKCTAMNYLHQYYCIESMKKSDRFIMATAALFVAAKAEDQPIPLDRLIKNGWPQRFHCHHDRSEEERNQAIKKINDAGVLSEISEYVLAGERGLFYALAFHLDTFNVHHMIVGASNTAFSKVSHVFPGNIIFKIAFELVEHSMRHGVCLRYTECEMMWAFIIVGARVMEMTDALFGKDGRPLWAKEGVAFHRLEALMSEAEEWMPLPQAVHVDNATQGEDLAAAGGFSAVVASSQPLAKTVHT